MLSLYEINGLYAGILNSASQAETPEEEQALLAQYMEVEKERDDKLTNCCAYYRNLEIEIDAYKQEIAHLKERKEKLEGKLERFENKLKDCLAGEIWENGTHSIKWRKSEHIEVVDEELVPAAYCRRKVTYEVDKVVAKKDIKSGATVPGLELKEEYNLQIK